MITLVSDYIVILEVEHAISIIEPFIAHTHTHTHIYISAHV